MNKSNYCTSMRNWVQVPNSNIRGRARTHALVRLIFGEKKEKEKKWLPGAQASLAEIVKFMFSGAACV